MYNPIIHPFYPHKTNEGTIVQAPLKKILLGEVVVDPSHPDPAIQAFLRYIPSLILQVLDAELDEDEWNELTQEGKDASCFQEFQERLSEKLEEMEDFFTLYPDKNGFYQHHEVKTQALSGEKGTGCKVIDGNQDGLDGLLIHAVSGNNHCHHKRPGLLRKICPACALTSLMHHNYFCVAGLAGPANLRGNQAYLCMLGSPVSEQNEAQSSDEPFKRMIRNIFLPDLNSGYAESLGWDKTRDVDLPSWLKPGRKKGKCFEILGMETGLIRATLHTPRHAFFDVEAESGICDLCGLTANQLVKCYYWRQGDKLNDFIGHPTLATYEEKGQTLPINYNPSIWRSLGALAMKNYQSSNRHFQAAPLVHQFSDLCRWEEEEFQLELQAYQTDKAKLLGFHHQIIQLPVFTKQEKDEQQEFYHEIEVFASVMGEMMRSFKYFGSTNKKRERVQIPGIEDKQRELVQSWGEQLLNRIANLRKAQKAEKLPQQLLEQLKHCKKALTDAFDQLCDSFAWDDASSQRKLCKQKRILFSQLNKQYAEYEKRFN